MKVFVDTGAWIALALPRDRHHLSALQAWEGLQPPSSALHTSVPVILETFTFLQRNTLPEVATAWQQSLREVQNLAVHPCTVHDLEESWHWFDRQELHKLSAVDATSFTLMQRLKIERAFTFDHHFAMADFQLVP